MTIETTLGLRASNGARTIDAGAGAGAGWIAVAEGHGGHSTGWLGARLAVRAIVDSAGHFVGAADEFPDHWGWAGAMQSREAARRVYEDCAASLGDGDELPRDLASRFRAVDSAVHAIPDRASIRGLTVSGVAATIDGSRIRGVHAGIGRAIVVRADRLEDLVTPHYLHLIAARMTVPFPPGFDPATLPTGIIANALGGLAPGVGIDEFEIELAAGDVLMLCSGPLGVGDDELQRILRATARAPVEDLARVIETRVSTLVAFAVVVGR